VRLVELYEQFRDQVEFMVVYVREAHPTDKWWLAESRTLQSTFGLSGTLARSDVQEPETLEERRVVAASCYETLFDARVPLFVDTIDDRVSTMYTAKPTRIYLIGEDGHVVYNPGIGPFGYNPDHLGREIESYLAGREAG
jgi:hypothetical protein